MRTNAEEEAKELINEMHSKLYSDGFYDAKQCAILAQERILELPIWNTFNVEELEYQREIMRELENL